MIPVQLIVLPQLSSKDYLWLSCLTKHFTPDTPLEALAHAYAPHQDEFLYQQFMNAVIRANLNDEGDERFMCEALYELFADELKIHEESGEQRGEEHGKLLGDLARLITVIQKKIWKGKTLAEISEDLEDTIENIRPIYQAVEQYPTYSVEQLLELVTRQNVSRKL